MRKIILFVICLVVNFISFAQVGVGTGTDDIAASAALEVRSTEKGFLVPRMTHYNRDQILNPDNGLLIYQTDNEAGFYYYNEGAWLTIGTSESMSSLIAEIITKIEEETARATTAENVNSALLSGNQLPSGAVSGQIMYYTGESWEMLASPTIAADEMYNLVMGASLVPFWRNVTTTGAEDPGSSFGDPVVGTEAKVGDMRDGGVVFWVDPSDNTKGLVCALEDQSASIQWFNGSDVTTNAKGTAIGTGAANTTAIITALGETATDYAAGLARAHTGGGYDDWFLPSKDELNQMYNNKATLQAATGFSPFGTQYWCSTELTNNLAWGQDFGDGTQHFYNEHDTLKVRAVRSFGADTTAPVADTTAPIITVTNGTDALLIGDAWVDAGATADTGEDVSASGSVDTSIAGDYTITYTATDAAGNIGTAERKVVVTVPADTTAPIITVTNGTDALVIGDAWVDAGATADTGEDVSASGSVDTSTAGDYTITYTATDAAGNIGTAERKVVVTVRVEAEVGDVREGGVVFWVDSDDNTKGLVCALEDQSAGIQWYNGTYVTTNATDTAIGTGAANTTAIIDVQGGTETAYAASLARAHTGGGYTDWFLPSKDELNEMYDKKSTLEAVAGFSAFSSGYWSSTEYSKSNAWSNLDDLNKSYADNVRAVRAF
jgi:hypothetical protein